MPNIKPSSEIRNNYNEISKFCHETNEPVFITKNGHGDVAVMSIEEYERLTSHLELYRLINEGLDDVENGRAKPFSGVFARLKKDFKDGTL